MNLLSRFGVSIKAVLKTLVSVVLVCAMMVFSLVSAHVNSAYADDSLPPDTKVSIFVDTYTKDKAGQNVYTYLSGQQFTVLPRFEVSGTGVDIPKGYAEVRVDKSQFVDKPQFVGSNNATFTSGENDTYWWARYTFDKITGGTKGAFPFTLDFKKYITPNNTKNSVHFGLYHADGTPIKTNDQPFTAQADDTYVPRTATSYFNDTHPYYGNKFNINCGYTTVPSTDHAPLKESCGNIAYAFSFRHIVPEGVQDPSLGQYVPTAFKVVNHLPMANGKIVGQIDPNNLKDGWVVDDNAGTATRIFSQGDRRVYSYYGKGTYVIMNWQYAQGDNKALLDTPYTNNVDFYKQVNDKWVKVEPGHDPQYTVSQEAIAPVTDTVTFHAVKETPGGFGLWKNSDGRGYNYVYSSTDNKMYATYGSKQEIPIGQSPDEMSFLWHLNPQQWHRYSNDNAEYITKLDDWFNIQSNIDRNLKFPDDVDTGSRYKSFTLQGFKDYIPGEAKPTDSALAKNPDAKATTTTQAMIDSIAKDGGYTLVAVDADGEETVLKDHVAYGEKVTINDPDGKYVRLSARFKTPLKIQNSTLNADVETIFTNAEIANWKKQLTDYKRTSGGEALHKRYYNNAALSFKDTPDSQDVKTFNSVNWFGVQNSTAYLRMEGRWGVRTHSDGDNVSMIYTKNYEDRKKSIYISDYLYGNNALTKDLDAKNTKIIVLLPQGLKYVKTTDKSSGITAEPTIVRNFKNTGKTAIIYDTGELKGKGDNQPNWQWANIEVDPTSYMTEGDNAVKIYIVWSNNDVVLPSAYYTSRIKDDLDLDGDGNRDESFQEKDIHISVVLPKELTGIKYVSPDGKNWFFQSPNSDLGSNIYYKLLLSNKYVTPIEHLSLYDTLPYLHDHKIAPNEDGQYLPRGPKGAEGSQFVTPLTGPIDEVKLPDGTLANNQPLTCKALGSDEPIPSKDTVNTLFDFYYTTDSAPDAQHGADLPNLHWVTKDQITDWSAVKNIKAVLKEEKTVCTGMDVPIITQNKIPFNNQFVADKFNEDKPNENPLANYTAYNSFAYHEGEHDSLIEGNEVSPSMVKYHVTGTVFRDSNKNGIFDKGEDTLKGYRVQLLTADGKASCYSKDNSAVPCDASAVPEDSSDPLANNTSLSEYSESAAKAGKRIEAVTDANGHYDLHVYARGDYKVRFIAPNGAANWTIIPDADNTPADAVVNQATAVDPNELGKSESAVTSAYTLDPSTLYRTYNAGVITKDRNVKLKKVDQDGNPLKNIPFTLHYVGHLDGDTADITPAPADIILSTNEDGFVTFKNIAYGKYTITEGAVPEGVEGLKKPLDIVVGPNAYAVDAEKNPLPYLTVTNTVIKGTVKIKKVDADQPTLPLQGAKFTLTKVVNGKLVEPTYTLVTGKDGTAQVGNVLYGSYRLREVSAPDHYLLNTSDERTVSIERNGSVVDLTGKPFTDTIMKGTVSVVKTDSETKLPVEGAKFGLFPVVDGSVASDALYQGSTDAQGSVSFTGVRYGEYKLEEISPATGYLPSTRQEDVNVDHDGASFHFDVVNTIKHYKVNVKKLGTVDFAGKKTVPLQGVVFDLQQNGQVKYQATTGADGVAHFTGVRYGEYTLVESKPAVGYLPWDQSGKVTVNATDSADGHTYDEYVTSPVVDKVITGTVRFTKVDARDNSPLSGVTFALYKAVEKNGVYTKVDGLDAVDTQTSDTHGVVTFAHVPYGNYVIEETHGLVNYNRLTADLPVSIVQNDKVVAPTEDGLVKNTIITGSVQVTKSGTVSADGVKTVPLQGVTFVLKQDGVEKRTAVTDVHGIATFNDVVYGTYTVAEKSGLKNYNLSDKTVSVDVHEQGKVYPVGFVNTIITGSVKLKKVDADQSGLVLQGAKFGVYRVHEDGSVDKTPSMSAVTDSEGMAVFNGLVYGSYRLREVSAPDHYLLNTSDERTVQVSTQGQVIDLSTKPFADKIFTGSIKIKKIDGNTRKPLANVQFGLFRATDIAAYDAALAAQKAASSVADGSIHGMTADKANADNTANSADADKTNTANGKNGDDKSVTKSDTGKASSDKMTNDGKTATDKMLNDKLKPIPMPKPVMQVTTNTMGLATFEHVRYGNYVIRELKTPTGYLPADINKKVSIEQDKQVVDLTANDNDWFVNNPIEGNVVFYKVDDRCVVSMMDQSSVVDGMSDKKMPLTMKDYMMRAQKAVANCKVLQGAHFMLKPLKSSLFNKQYEAVSDAQGRVLFKNVLFGEYQLVETSAPEGYEVNRSLPHVKVQQNGTLTVLSPVKDKLIPIVQHKLSTTGTDIVLPSVMSMLLLTLGAVFITLRKSLKID